MRCAALTNSTHEHFHLLHHVPARQSDVGNDDLFKTHGITTVVANEVHVIIAVLSSGAVVFT
ncbi:MAG TPA: hypothetical protein VKR41_04215 [Puia sp.]|nr:hypothetical protein [Puia sp.]